MNLLRTVSRLFLLVTLGTTPVLTQADNAVTKGQVAALRFLHGAIDMHFHMDPPTEISPGGLIDQVREARLLGLRGLLFKSHGESTAILAYHLGLEMPDINLVGGIVLNSPIGGINLAAVERLASMKGHPGRVVWMPTENSEAQVKLKAKMNPDKPARQIIRLLSSRCLFATKTAPGFALKIAPP